MINTRWHSFPFDSFSSEMKGIIKMSLTDYSLVDFSTFIKWKSPFGT